MMQDQDVSIYDETRIKNYKKTDNRFAAGPDEKMRIDSKG
jgi:hypothetical protein